MAHAHVGTVKNPGTYQVSASKKSMFMLFLAIGVIAFILGIMKDPTRTWFAFVHNHFYFYSLAIGGMFFAATQWVTSAMWSAPIRRIAEAYTSYLPVALVTFVILGFGINSIYVWSHPEHVEHSLVLQGKSGYLSTGFFMARNFIALAILIFFTKKMVGNSLAQDISKDPNLSEKNKSLSPGFLILFAIGFTMAAFDQLMSLDPHWFSTMFGVYCFAGMFYSVLALTAILTVQLKKTGALEGIVNDNHLHDLGKFMFAFVVFYAYIGFSQFMLIWYANLPEETGYFIHRMHGNWLYVSLFLIVGKFAIPFLMLLPRGAKRCGTTLTMVGAWMLVAHWIDIMWLSQPEMPFGDSTGHGTGVGAGKLTGPVLGLIEIGMALGFVGIFGLCVSKFFAKNNIVAIGDPKLAESVFHHHQ